MVALAFKRLGVGLSWIAAHILKNAGVVKHSLFPPLFLPLEDFVRLVGRLLVNL